MSPARLVFGRAEADAALTHTIDADAATAKARSAALTALLSTVPQAGTNTVLAGHTGNLMDASNLPRNAITMEITEGTLMENVPATMSALHSLERRGVRLAVDDFGVGHSSLSYLRRFSVDVLKIDRSFVHDAMADDDARSIVRAMVSLGRALEIGIVAEGVETPEQHALLASMGCECAQGFLFGRPMTVDALTKVAACWVPRNLPAG